MRTSKLHRSAPQRRGAIILLFVLLVFVALGIAGVVIDMGSASLAQTQMQDAVDTAAIEGCRLRNYEEYPGLSHSGKRGKVSHLVRQAFDEDLRVPTANGAQEAPDGVTVGSILDVRNGQGSGNVGATIGQHGGESLAALEDPTLQRNLENLQYGDQVAGTFTPYSTEGENPISRPGEQGDYSRTDFARTDAPIQTYQALSYLVRMRRSGGTNPLDAQNGVSTHLPRIPMLFALGSTMQGSGEGWNPRTDGVTVRATAIASARPALRVGAPPRQGTVALADQSTFGTPIRGTYPFALSAQAWAELLLDDTNDWHQPRHYRVLPEGTLHAEGTTGATHGRFYVPPVSLYSFTEGDPPYPEMRNALASVGRAVAAPPLTDPKWGIDPDQRSYGGYVPIYDTIPGPDGDVERVIGYTFAFAEYTTDPLVCVSGDPIVIVRPGFSDQYTNFGAWVAQDNASAHLGAPATDPLTAGLSADEWRAVIEKNEQLAYHEGALTYDYASMRRGILLAPALSR